MSAVRQYQVIQVDVFTDRVFGGNPLAVITNPQGLSSLDMQSIAKEMNLSETSFILPAADANHSAKVRIFTPAQELPFAGHPTLGTAWVLATEGLARGSELTLEEGVGPVSVRLEGDPANPDFLWLRSPPAVLGHRFDNRADFAGALGLTEGDLLEQPLQVASAGVPYLMVPLATPRTVDAIQLDVARLLASFADHDPLAVFVFAPNGDDRFYSRMFAPHTVGIAEDPATGSAHGPLGAYLARYRLAEIRNGLLKVVSEQGTKMGRQSFAHVHVSGDGGTVDVGGQVVPVMRGALELPG